MTVQMYRCLHNLQKKKWKETEIIGEINKMTCDELK